MEEQQKKGSRLESRILVFNKSEELKKLEGKLYRRGFRVEAGKNEDIAALSANDIDAKAIIYNFQNSNGEDLIRISGIRKKFPHTPLILIVEQEKMEDIKDKLKKSVPGNNISYYTRNDLENNNTTRSLAQSLEKSKVIQKGIALVYDPKDEYKAEIERIMKHGIFVENTRSREDFEKKLKFHHSKIDATIIKIDSIAPELISVSKEKGAKVIAINPSTKVDDDLKNAKPDYMIQKARKRDTITFSLEMYLDQILQMKKKSSGYKKIGIASAPEKEKSLGRLTYIMGPTASGKTTLQKNITMLLPDSVQFSPKMSTRPLRIDEDDGKDLVSLDDATFEKMRKLGTFIHVFEYRGHKYGFHNSILNYLRAGTHIITLNPDFTQLKFIEDALLKEFSQNVVMPVLIFADKETLEQRLEDRKKEISETVADEAVKSKIEQEIDLRKSKLQEELDMFDRNYELFKYRIFTHAAHDTITNAKRLAAAIKWEQEHPGLGYADLHEHYVENIVQILTGRKLPDLDNGSIEITVSPDDIIEFCTKHKVYTGVDKFLSDLFPLNVKCSSQDGSCVSNFGRLGLYISDANRFSPMERDAILQLLNYVLEERAMITPKATTGWGKYSKNSVFGLLAAKEGEVCDGVCYALTDEYCLHNRNEKPFMISVGFYAGPHTGELDLMSITEVNDLASIIKPAGLTDYEFLRAVRKYNEKNPPKEQPQADTPAP